MDCEFQLKNLLAVIHRDGGCYTHEYGVEKSVQDAIQKVADLFSIVDKHKEEI